MGLRKDVTLEAARKFRNRMWIPQQSASSPSELKGDLADASKLNDETGNISEMEQYKENENTLSSEDDIVTFKFITCFVVICGALGITALDYSATGNIMAQIGTDLHGSTTEVEWIGNGYSLSACLMQLPISALSDIFGRRALLMVSLGFFLIGSILCGTAQNMSAMIAGRVIQGAGGGGCYVLPEVILADTVPLRSRSLFYSVLMVVWAVFSGAAPLIAGAFAEYASWRWFFYMNIMIVGTCMAAAPFCIRLKNQVGHDNPWWVKLRSIDYVGALLTVGSGVAVLLALSRGGSTSDLPWSHWSIVVPLVVGFVGFVITAVYEYWYKPKVPMFNIRVFNNVSASICYLHNILQGIVNLCSIYYLPSFFQGAKGYGPVVSGACILPLNMVGPPIVLIIGIIINRTGHYHIMNLIMWGLSTAGMGLMTLNDGHRSIAALIFLQVTGSIGINCLYSTLSITANATNPPSLWTESTAMMSFCRAFGDTFGTAIGGAVLASQMRTRLNDLTTEGYYVPDSTNVLTLVETIRHIDSPQLKEALVGVLSKSISTLFYVLTAFSAASFILTFFQKEYSLDQHGESKQGIDN